MDSAVKGRFQRLDEADASNAGPTVRSPATERGELHVTLTDSADNFLNVARDALQLNFGEIELQPLP